MNSYHATQVPKASRSKEGFALLVALVLMAFLLLLMVSLSTLLRLELSLAGAQHNKELARLNALLGLEVALGELQRSLGPDTRVSGRAELLEGAGQSVVHPYWTGAWQPAWDGGSAEGVDPRGRPQHITWLVSGNNLQETSFTPDAEIPENTRSTTLARLELQTGGGSFALHEVKAPYVGLEKGGFSYWVSDEGVKAKVSAVAENYATQGSPLLPLGIDQQVFDDVGLSEDFRFENPLLWRDVLTMQQVVDDDTSRLRLAPHSTLVGHGVLADSLRGGLRLDLSALAGMTLPQASTLLSSPLLPGAHMFDGYVSGNTLPRGPNWDVLWQFMELSTQGSGAFPVRPRVVAGSQTTQLGVYPVIERFQLYVVPRLSEDLTGGADPDVAEYRPRLYMLPAVVLWNPYDRELVAPEGMLFSVERSTGQVNAWKYIFAAGYYDGVNWQKIPTGNDTDIGEFPDMLLAGGGLNFRLQGGGGGPVVIPPGQGRIFTLTANAAITSLGPWVMEPGFRNFGVYLDSDDVIVVPESTLGGRDIYLDIRHQGFMIGGSGPFGPGDIFLNLDDANGNRMQRVGHLRWGDTDSALRTVSELNPSPSFGEDPNGPEPFAVARDGIPANSIPAYSPGTEDVAIGYEVGLKTPESRIHNTFLWQEAGERPLARLNPRAPAQGVDEEARDGYDNNRPANYGARVIFTNQTKDHFGNENYLVDTWGDDNSYTYVGYGDEVADGVTRAVYFHLPDAQWYPRSVGDFRHLDLAGNDASTPGPGGVARNLAPAFVIGEARADPFVSRQTHGNFPLSRYMTNRKVDYQWLANRAMWDRFFVSTVPHTGNLEFPLRNGLMTAYGIEKSGLRAEDIDALRDLRRAASSLLVDGAFNVNSTSVKAWEALLGRYLGESVSLRDGSVEQDADLAPFLGIPRPHGTVFSSGDTASQALYDGYRSLDRDAIRDLAEAIVAEVKRRGPFASLSDFVNRSVRTENRVFIDALERGESVAPGYQPLNQASFTLADLAQEPRLFGTLQAAIERAGLNDDLDDTYFMRKLSPHWGPASGQASPWRWAGTANNAGAYGAYMEGAPGYLSQGVILARLGPMLSARSDTFVVRAYGDAVNPLTGQPSAQAWCEAVIQRLPDFVDRSESAETRPDDLLEEANLNFGRRFVVIGFRWLEEAEL